MTQKSAFLLYGAAASIGESDSAVASDHVKARMSKHWTASICPLLWGMSFLLFSPRITVSGLSPMSTNLVRISETPANLGEDEKETALLLLRDWGLGSFRLFAELAGGFSAL